MSAGPFPRTDLVIFVGYSDDAREVAEAICSLAGALQEELDAWGAGQHGFTKIRLCQWRDSARQAAGGQGNVAPLITRDAHATLFVFKGRVGEQSKEEIDRVVERDLPVTVIFPRHGPPERDEDADVSASWTDLLRYKKKLVDGWGKQGSRAIPPVDPYDDLDALKAIAQAALHRMIGDVLRRPHPRIDDEGAIFAATSGCRSMWRRPTFRCARVSTTPPSSATNATPARAAR